MLIEAFGAYELAIHEVPALLKEADLEDIMMHIADLAEEDSPVDIVKKSSLRYWHPAHAMAVCVLDKL